MAKFYIWNFKVGSKTHDGWAYGPNSAGGISLQWDFKNETGKTIKYATFWFVPYNRVGDIQCCSISKESEDGVTYTGPLDHGGIHRGALWENAWYNHSISDVKLTKIYVVYMDGTDELLSASDVSFSVPEGVSANGCYVATAVYGSYDCPQVWTLRRFRDNTLAGTWYGRAFIKTYYTISPTLVKWFGQTNWFKKLWKKRLDRMVSNLQSAGVESSPYQDKTW
ncbi:MAG: hypothetical protein E7455_07825 [Ruminococcaceae bacterium]|nr:hypothetical protein [Oscillospiraceae bacterium]